MKEIILIRSGDCIPLTIKAGFLIFTLGIFVFFPGCDSMGEDIGPAAGLSQDKSVTVYVNGTFYDNDELRDAQGGIWIYPTGGSVDFQSALIQGHAGKETMRIDNTHGYCEVAVFLSEGIIAGNFKSLSFWARSLDKPVSVTLFAGRDNKINVNAEETFSIQADGRWHRNEIKLAGGYINHWTIKVMGDAGEGKMLFVDDVKFIAYTPLDYLFK